LLLKDSLTIQLPNRKIKIGSETYPTDVRHQQPGGSSINAGKSKNGKQYEQPKTDDFQKGAKDLLIAKKND
jgi:hypothetical protein